MKVLLFGGSNSLMRDGYTVALRRLLGESLETGLTLLNRSIGGTNSILALELASCEPDPESIDAVLIEYCINDIEMLQYAKGRFWQAGFEGLVRLCRRRFAKAVIGVVILGRRDEKHWKAQDTMTAAIHRLAAAYEGVVAIDVDSFIKSVFGTGDGFTRLYADQVHYLRAVQAVAGVYAGGRLAEFVKARVFHPFDQSTVDPVLGPVAFDRPQVLSLIDGRWGETRRFANSRFA